MTKRRLSQLLSLILLHASWGPEFKWLCNPVLSCHSCVLSWFACPVGVFVHYSGYHLFPFFALGTVLLLGTLLGRLLCGWVCPFGFLQDLLHKIPSPKFVLPDWTGYLKYGVLAAGVVLLPFIFGSETMLSFCRICPAATLQVGLPALFTQGFQPSAAALVRWGALIVILLLAILSSRSFCKTLCPIGAMLGPLNYLSFWTVKPPTENCASCGKCDKVCAMAGRPSERVKEHVPANRLDNCIDCHECQDVCPKRKV